MNGVDGRPSRTAWAAPLAVNTVLGYFGTLPLSLTWIFLANYPLAAVGLTQREPTDNDGILPWLIVLGGIGGLCLALWAAVNIAVRRLTKLPARRYWPFSAVVSLIPTIVFVVAPGVWETLRWY
ncbi:hypothetical protein [Microtetraspora niveoalba]|uniref:hypothetical protein n=1 Tax=Microtetraspora niveoalba TaxID=46175 RepID=UPI0008341D49|nr:hypothetical protein [Microtetraspora niveoalba]